MLQRLLTIPWRAQSLQHWVQELHKVVDVLWIMRGRGPGIALVPQFNQVQHPSTTKYDVV